MIRPYHYLVLAVLLLCIGINLIFFHMREARMYWNDRVKENQSITAILGLSDLALSTEARYIRHLSLSDFFSAFQDTPSGFDLFPSGSFVHPLHHRLMDQKAEPVDPI